MDLVKALTIGPVHSHRTWLVIVNSGAVSGLVETNLSLSHTPPHPGSSAVQKNTHVARDELSVS